MTPDDRDEIVKTIVKDTLAERFTPDEFVFRSHSGSAHLRRVRRRGRQPIPAHQNHL